MLEKLDNYMVYGDILMDTWVHYIPVISDGVIMSMMMS